MTIACAICATTQGPFMQEPTGVTSSPVFIKCQSFASKFQHVTFVGTVGRGASPQSVQKYFYSCRGCGNLYYKAIPYAFLHFDVRECPSCSHPFPNEGDIEYLESNRTYQVALMGGGPSVKPEEWEGLYDQVSANQPALSKAIDDVMLVETPKGKDIWVITLGASPQVEDALRAVLMKASDRKLSFSSSRKYEIAMKGEGLEVLKRMKGR